MKPQSSTTATTVQCSASAAVLSLTALRTIECGEVRATAEEAELLQLALASYTFCLRTSDFTWPSTITLARFADAIEKVYDCAVGSPNAQVVCALRSIHGRMAHDEDALA